MAVTESRTKCSARACVHYTRFSARNAVRPVCKPVQEESEIAYAKIHYSHGRVKPLARLLRVCRA